MSSIALTLPYQINLTDNHRLGRGRGRTFLKKDTKRWQADTATRARNAVNVKNLTLTPPLTIRVKHYLPIGCKADPSNFHKSLGDGLKVGLDIDDIHFRFVDAHVEYVRRGEARFVVRVLDANEAESVEALEPYEMERDW